MDINQVASKASSGFVTLKDGETVRLTINGEFKEVTKDYNGETRTTYDVPVIVLSLAEPQEKLLSKSASFFKQMNEAAELAQIPFNDAVFAIKRSGAGKFDTRYTFHVSGRKSGIAGAPF